MPSCRDLCRAIASEELEQARAWPHLRARLHLLLCRNCRRYAAQIACLDREARALLGRAPGASATLSRLRARILERSKPESTE